MTDISPTAVKIQSSSMWCHNNGVEYDWNMIMMSEILKIIKIYKDFTWTTALNAVVMKHIMINIHAWLKLNLSFVYKYDAQMYLVTDSRMCMMNRSVQVRNKLVKLSG